MQQLLGIAIVLGAVFGGFTLMGGTFTSIFHPIELLIIGGAALGALVLGNPKHVLAELGHQLKKVAARKKHDSEFQRQLLLLMYELLQTAAGGLKALDAHVEAPAESPLFQRYPAILDELRRQDWRPRAVRQDSHRQRDALRALTRSLGREPNEQEAAAALGLSPDEYQQYLLAESAEEMLSFDEILQEAVGAAQHTPGPEDAYMVRRSLEQALARLNDKEQRVIQMIYEFELSYKEIAAVLDLSDARVCQLNKSALAKMKTALRRD